MTIIVVVMAMLSLSASVTTNTTLPAPAGEDNRRWSASIEGDVKQRIQQLDLPFPARYDAHIGERIKEYTVNGYRETEEMLGLLPHYLPIFEHYLQQYDLPDALKYLPVVETGLKVEARSWAGAAGLWQFIPYSARLYGLQNNSRVDERLDVYKSTEAAIQMLSALYKQYKNWPLVLAAYNCGPVRVNQAIRQSGCRDFWTLREYLPQETSEYVSRFIAAAYIANFYADHNLQPRYSDRWPMQTRTLVVYDPITFGQIAFAGKVDIATVRRLNPSHKKDRIAANAQGNYLVLPASAVAGIQAHLSALKGGASMDPLLLYPGHQRLDYVVRPGETIGHLARRFNCTAQQIMQWNDLRHGQVVTNQPLAFYLPNAGQYLKP